MPAGTVGSIWQLVRRLTLAGATNVSFRRKATVLLLRHVSRPGLGQLCTVADSSIALRVFKESDVDRHSRRWTRRRLSCR